MKTNETLYEQLEWHTLVGYIAEFAVFPETRAELLSLSPTLDEAECEAHFDETDELKRLVVERDPISRVTLSFSDTLGAARRRADMSAEQLFAVGSVLGMGVEAHQFVTKEKKQATPTSFPLLVERLSILVPHTQLAHRISRSVDSEGAVLDTASHELGSARQAIHTQRNKIGRELDRLVRGTEFKDSLQDNTWMHRDGRYVLPVKAEKRNTIPGTIRGFSQSGSTVFIEPISLQNAQSELEELEYQAKLIEFKILHELSMLVADLYDDLVVLWDTLLWYDAAIARASLASRIGAVRPEFMPTNGDIRFEFIGARHPLFTFENKPCVPNDLNLKRTPELKQAPQAWVLSGPNAGGKTVAMRTVGILVLMAKAGLFVPALNAKMQFFTDVFVELGDRQNRADSLSSFSGHLLYLKRIVDAVKPQSLVLIDEGFVGTDPVIGMALARATLERLVDKGATVIITTHYTNLKTLAQSDSRFYNGSMEFESQTLSPTYKMLNGVPGQSYAIELATRMQFDPEILSLARLYQGEESNRLERLLKDLQLRKDELTREQQEFENLNDGLKNELQSFKDERSRFNVSQNTLATEFSERMQKQINMFSHALQSTERYYERELKRHYKQAVMEIDEQAAAINPDLVKVTDQNRSHYENQPDEPEHHETHTHDDDDHDDISLHKRRRQALPLPTNAQTKAKPAAHKPAPAPVQNKKPIPPPPQKQHKPVQPLKPAAVAKPKPQQLADFRQLRDIKLPSKSEEMIFDALEKSKLTKEKVEVLEKEFLTAKLDLANEFESLNRAAGNLKAQHHAHKSISPEMWKEGTPVRHPRFKETGKVLREANKSGLVECQFGMIKAKIDYEELMTPEEWLRQKQGLKK